MEGENKGRSPRYDLALIAGVTYHDLEEDMPEELWTMFSNLSYVIKNGFVIPPEVEPVLREAILQWAAKVKRDKEALRYYRRLWEIGKRRYGDKEKHWWWWVLD